MSYQYKLELWLFSYQTQGSCGSQMQQLVTFHHPGTMTCFSTLCRNSKISFSRCHTIHACSSHLLESLLMSSRLKQCCHSEDKVTKVSWWQRILQSCNGTHWNQCNPALLFLWPTWKLLKLRALLCILNLFHQSSETSYHLGHLETLLWHVLSFPLIISQHQ